MKHTLQNIIFSNDLENTESLYINTNLDLNSISFDNKKINLISNVQRLGIFSFDTYFNAFSLYIWNKYSYLKNLNLELDICGKGIIKIIGLTYDNIEDEISEESFDTSIDTKINININYKSDYILVFFKIITMACSLSNACWYTNIENKRIKDVRLSICICTYKREMFVINNLNKIIEFKNNYPDLNDKLFIHISDNGRTLKKQGIFTEKNIFLHKNINSGGSGGFARCMLETLNMSPSATHILLMDDDIVLNTESLFRTIKLFNILKEEYNNYCIAGAMLDLRKPYIQSAREEDFFPIQPLHRNLRPDIDIRDRKELLVNDGPQKYDNLYAAWWYCSFSITILKNGLSYPLFFQFDDIEFAIRNKLKPIHLNGISVWHEPFWAKFTNSKEFYATRNLLIVSSLVNTNTLFILIKLFKRCIEYLFIYNYTAANYIISGIEAYLNGPNFLLKDNFWNVSPKLKDYSIKYKVNLNDIKLTYRPEKINYFKICLSIFTFNGYLIPNFLLKNSEYLVGSPRKLWKNLLLKKKSRFVINDICIESEISRIQFLMTIIKLCKVLTLYLIKYKNINKVWFATKNIFVSNKWWQKKLI